MTLNKTLAFGTLVSLCEELGWGTSLVVQWLSLRAPTAEGMGLNPGQGTKIPHAAWWSQKAGGGEWIRMIKSIPSSCWNPCFSYPVCGSSVISKELAVYIHFPLHCKCQRRWWGGFCHHSGWQVLCIMWIRGCLLHAFCSLHHVNPFIKTVW